MCPDRGALSPMSEKKEKVIVNGRKKKGFFRTLFRLAVFCLLLGGTLAALGGAALYTITVPSVPMMEKVSDYKPRLGSRIYSVDDQLIGEFSAERRVMVPYDRIPIRLIQAFIAAEDKRFFSHHGMDYIGLINAIMQKVKNPKAKLRGASTITQQFAKSILMEHEGYESATARSYMRKVREAIIARRLEQVMDKEDIIYLYLNQIYLGHRAYGVQAAAQHYFRKNVWDLNLAEMATLAGLPQRPSDFSPYSRPKKAKARRRYVLTRMLEEGFISQKEFDDNIDVELTVYPLREPFLEHAPYFTETVRREIIDMYGEQALLEEGLQVYTTMVPAKQAAGQRALNRALLALDKRQGYRGPLANIPEKEWPAFLKDAAKETPINKDNIDEGRRYLAIVTGFDSERKDVFVNVAGVEGIMPLAAMRWARKPNTEVYYSDAYVTDPTKVLKKGDVILVTPTTWRKLSADRFGYEIISTVKVRPDKPMFALDQDPIAQGAILGIDARDGYVEGMVGGYDFADSTLNRTRQACRQPGSSFKPVIYATAVDKKNYTPSTIIIDSPIVEDDPDNANRWKPSNVGMDFKGDVPIRTCIRDSMNICSVKTLKDVGVKEMIAYARRLGVTTPLTPDLSLALGSSCVTMWDMVGVYSVFNRGGIKKPMHIIKRVVDRNGKTIYDVSAPWDPSNTFGEQLNRGYAAVAEKQNRIMDQPTAYIMTSLLHNVVEGGTAMSAKRIKKPACGKTGTTNDSFDTWFMGFTEDYVTGAWIGHDRNERPLGIKEFGGNTPMPMWVDYMLTSTQDIEQKFPDPPVGIVQVTIDPENGLLATKDTPKKVREYYRAGTEPKEFSMRGSNLATENIYTDDE